MSCCQCERNISKIINFCFIIAHEICDNELIKSFMNLKSSMFYFKFVNMFLSQSFFDQTEKFAHYQYYYTIFIDDRVWCIIENNKKIIRKIVFFTIVNDIYYIMSLNMFRAIIASIDWKTIALFSIKIFHSSMITIDAL